MESITANLICFASNSAIIASTLVSAIKYKLSSLQSNLSRLTRFLNCDNDSSAVQYNDGINFDIRATKSDNSVVLPAPGSPEIILTEPVVNPPHNTRSSSPMPVSIFWASTASTSCSFLEPPPAIPA